MRPKNIKPDNGAVIGFEYSNLHPGKEELLPPYLIRSIFLLALNPGVLIE